MNINALLYAVPAEPYKGIISELLTWGIAEKNGKKQIVPRDCETRTFFHDIPVIETGDPDTIVEALSERKSTIIREGPAIACYGTVSPEQAFVSFSSTCFSTFVKYFLDHLLYMERGDAPEGIGRERTDAFNAIAAKVSPSSLATEGVDDTLIHGPPVDEAVEQAMLVEAGKRLVQRRLVDSYFGNISSCFGDWLFISETAASLDELEGALDAVPLDGSSSVGITSSSELATHRRVFDTTDARVLLHGHPKFSVIMSMYCTEECDHRRECYRSCNIARTVCDVPIVPGEIGTGTFGIMNTVPKAFQAHDAVIVYGHGVFCRGTNDFNAPLARMEEIEACCRNKYFQLIDSFGRQFLV